MTKRIMRAFKLSEISCVDRPAQEGAIMVIMKRDEGGRDIASELSASNREFAKLLHQYRNPGADIVPLDLYRHAAAIRKGTPMEKTEAQVTEELRKGLESGALKNWTPEDFDGLIKQLAEDHARPNETEAQAYTRMIMEHPAGQRLYKGYRAASLGGVFAQGVPCASRFQQGRGRSNRRGACAHACLSDRSSKGDRQAIRASLCARLR
jgi:hypothetical protein